MKVGFIGLGLMGMPMSKNIIKAGFDLTVYNRTLSKSKQLQNSAKTAKSPQELAKIVDVIITMVTAGKDVEEVLFGKNGVVKDAKKGLIVVDMSTIGPTYAKRIAKKLEKYSIKFLDAPVTGSTPKAITGELTIFIGGNRDVYEKVKSVLMAMGKNHHYMGPNGSGQAMKMINNQVLATTIEGLAEGMILADSMKISREKVAAVLKTVPAMSPMMNLKLPNYVNNTYPLLFSMANMSKDLTLALAEVKRDKFPVLKRLEAEFRKATKKYANEDFTVIIKEL
ncbi:NAD(P)-dependent oxidoreductase [Candidatus Gottesmanbacteria bacterium]|nr:NAD(P)-dependent oxidoreductase [Candidatus Gottesmanbacteria bacterium]